MFVFRTDHYVIYWSWRLLNNKWATHPPKVIILWNNWCCFDWNETSLWKEAAAVCGGSISSTIESFLLHGKDAATFIFESRNSVCRRIVHRKIYHWAPSQKNLEIKCTLRLQKLISRNLSVRRISRHAGLLQCCMRVHLFYLSSYWCSSKAKHETRSQR